MSGQYIVFFIRFVFILSSNTQVEDEYRFDFLSIFLVPQGLFIVDWLVTTCLAQRVNFFEGNLFHFWRIKIHIDALEMYTCGQVGFYHKPITTFCHMSINNWMKLYWSMGSYLYNGSARWNLFFRGFESLIASFQVCLCIKKILF